MSWINERMRQGRWICWYHMVWREEIGMRCIWVSKMTNFRPLMLLISGGGQRLIPLGVVVMPALTSSSYISVRHPYGLASGLFR